MSLLATVRVFLIALTLSCSGGAYALTGLLGTPPNTTVNQNIFIGYWVSGTPASGILNVTLLSDGFLKTIQTPASSVSGTEYHSYPNIGVYSVVLVAYSVPEDPPFLNFSNRVEVYL